MTEPDTTGPAPRDPMTTEPTCPHDTITEAAGLRVCLDCGEPNPTRRRATTRTQHTQRRDPMTTDLMHGFVEASAVFMHRAVKTGEPSEQWYEWLMISLYASTSAWLLAALETHAPSKVEAVAEELELMGGEALFQWVGDEARSRGIDLEAVVRQAEERRQAHLARTREETTR